MHIHACFASRCARPSSRATALAIAMALSACASPYAPPVTLAEPAGASIRPPELAHAFALAQQKHSSYRAKVIELGESERNFSNGVLGLGTVILGLVTADVHVSALKGAALGTGAVYTTGVVNTDRRRGQIYLEGMATLECAVAATHPLALNSASEKGLTNDRWLLAQGVSKLSTAVAAARAQVAMAQAYDSAMFAESIKPVDALIVDARSAMDASARADQLARQRLEVTTFAALGLRNTILGVDREVLKQIESTRPTLQSIPEQLSQLKTNALFTSLTAIPSGAEGKAAPSTIKPAPTPTPHSMRLLLGNEPTPQPAGERALEVARKLAAAIGDLQAATLSLKNTADRISTTVAATATQVSDALKACKVEGVVKPLGVSQSTVRIPAGKTLIQQIFVDGGNGILRAGFTQKPVPGLTVNTPPGTLGVVEIQATDKTLAGTYPLMIEDSTQASRVTISVVVEAANDSDTEKKNPSDAGEKGAAVDAAILNLQKRTEFRTADGAKVTIANVKKRGTSGIEVTFSATDPAVTAEQVEQAIKSDAQIQALLGSTADIKAEKNKVAPNAGAFFLPGTIKGMSRDDIRKLQARLCVPAAGQDGHWGPQTQRMLEEDRSKLGRLPPMPTGELTARERDQLLALTDAAAAARCAQRAAR
jgi:hypothetical protein